MVSYAWDCIGVANAIQENNASRYRKKREGAPRFSLCALLLFLRIATLERRARYEYNDNNQHAQEGKNTRHTAEIRHGV